MKSLEAQIAELKRKLARARNRADYWRRKARNPRDAADRKWRWRKTKKLNELPANTADSAPTQEAA